MDVQAHSWDSPISRCSDFLMPAMCEVRIPAALIPALLFPTTRCPDFPITGLPDLLRFI
jgi:hypothetical protein